MPFYLRAFLAVALEWRAQARNAALQTQTLQALETRVATLEEEKKILGRQNEAYQATLKQAQEAKKEAEKQLAEAVELQVDRLERVEGEIATQAKTMGLLQADYDNLQVEVSRLRVEKESLEKQVASWDATIEELEKDKKTLVNDMAGTFEEGFERGFSPGRL